MTYPMIVEAFVKLGQLFTKFCENHNADDNNWILQLQNVVEEAEKRNAWFTEENIRYALSHWGYLLSHKKIIHWQEHYSISKNIKPMNVGVIMAGNIPLVGFHDFLCVLLSGNCVIAKLSSNDNVLLPFITYYLGNQYSQLESKITFTEEKLTDFDAIIATGSNNTSRYFEYYFGRYPNIIRKNRSSLAILTGNESSEELEALGEDIFRYFGLGCRNVSKLFVPRNYNFDQFFKVIFSWEHLLHHHKYVNNYDYNKAVYLMSEVSILDNGFVILKEDQAPSSPIGAVFYEYYDDIDQLEQKLKENREDLQCIVSRTVKKDRLPFGATQKPELHDYADGIDTMKFLVELNNSA